MLSSRLKANQVLGFVRKRSREEEAFVAPRCISKLCPRLECECHSGPCQKGYDRHKRTGKDSEENSDQRRDPLEMTM